MDIRAGLVQFARRFQLRKTYRSRQRRLQQRLFLVEQLEDRRLMATIDLATLTASQGTVIFGSESGDYSGRSVSNAGDLNGDGFDDLLIGAYKGDGLSNTRINAGDTYVVFGSPSMPATVDLGNLGSAGLSIYGIDGVDLSGKSVSSGGDINGDGFDDLIIASSVAYASGNAKSKAGESYVIYGASVLPSSISLASLGSAGITIFGADVDDRSGTSVASAGDVNGDGYDDFVIGAIFGDASNNMKSNAGDSYLIFGGASLPTTINLASLGSVGVTIFGEDNDDQSGYAVGGTGDVNGDGFDDLLIGARFADGPGNGRPNAGESYVVFGKADWSTTSTIDLTSLGAAGIKIYGADAYDKSGVSIRNAGDVNGDGFDDLVIGAYTADSSGNSRSNAGDSYVVFGKALPLTTIDLLSLGANGVTIYGVNNDDLSGRSVSGAGDVNGDGFDDLLIGAFQGDAFNNNKLNAGESYVIFGGASLPTALNLDSLASLAGMTIFGAETVDGSGVSVSGAGDVNGDGFDDLLIGAYRADASGNNKIDAGESYLLFGGNFTSAITHQGTAASETLTGTASPNVMNGSRGDDTLVGNGGADVLTGGQGNDILAISDLTFKRIVGGTGNDKLRLDGAGLSLNLTTLRDNRLRGIEQIDITGSGVNTLTLNSLEVLNLSDSTNTLFVYRDSSDVVNRGSGWTQLADRTIGSSTFNVFTQGAAKLFVQIPFAGPTLTVTSGNKVYDKLAYTATASITGANAPTPTLLYSYFTDVRGLSPIAAPTTIGTYYVKALTNANASNLASESLISQFTITQKQLTVTGTSANKIYDGTTGVTVSLILSGIVPTDSVTGSAPGTFDNKNVGIGKMVTIGAGTIAGVQAGNYVLGVVPSSTTANIATKLLIGSITVADKEFDSTTSATILTRTLSGVEAGDTLSYVGGTANFDTPLAGTDKTVTATGLSLSGSDMGNYTVNSTATTTANIVDSVPPKITNVFVAGTAWSGALIDAVDGSGIGAGNGLGYALTSGLTLPNLGINRIYIQFSEPVDGFDSSTVALLGVNVTDYSAEWTVSYDSDNMRGVIELTNSLIKDKLRIGVSDAIADLATNKLDGDSNMLAGGVFDLRFNVLVGDANNDGSVNGGDLPSFAASFNKSAGNVAYNARADWNSDGSVNGGDLPLFATNFNQSLPGAEPAALNFPPPPAPNLELSYAPLIEEFDNVFRYWDAEDELMLFDDGDVW